jgi:hypothetical protein
MNNSHPSEKDIQQYAIDQSECTSAVTKHIEFCGHCLAEVKSYRHLFSEINQQPKPVFDFDVSDMVIPQLTNTGQHVTADRFIAGFLVLFISCFIGIPIFLFRFYILNMFSGIPPFFIYAIICSASAIILFQTLETYKNFQKKMHLLNLNEHF